MAIKLDLHKAYDNINWNCILEVMGRFGFSTQWCNLIRECISFPSFSIIINGHSSPWFGSKCGIRQGDPLFPFLFLFGMCLLELEIRNQISEGKVTSQGSQFDEDISLLSYVDDVMLVTKANTRNVWVIMDILSKFKKWIGLHTNMSKFHIMFSPSISLFRKKEILRVLNFWASQNGGFT